ncbi:RHS repeat-associated core domain-containing protein, partial [Streptomyces sp. NPDC050263]|uniref:RHS repeat-associated core domain-containing protein n=1 Tax=Streptomyces sp. NPDC050263 TaxID=3155037 RepID=UPI003445E7F3
TNKLTYLTGDQHNTSSLALNPDTGQTFTKRYLTPFGADRGTPLYGPWPDDKGFLGKTKDATTGLTHIGAREYDPAIGQFISVDPILAMDAPQSLNGYSYAGNNPVTSSDPTGLCADFDCPTRPGPGYENTTPGHTPGPPKKSANTIAAENGECYNCEGTASSDSGGNVIVLAEVPEPQQYVYQAPNGVCIFAVASSCGTGAVGSPPGASDIPDLPCPAGESQWVCSARNQLYKFGMLTGMTGGSIGLFGLRPGTRWNQLVRLPEGLTRSQFSEIGGAFRKELNIDADVVVQGSRVTGNVTGASDLDIAVRVTPESFDSLVAKRWPNVKPGSAQERTRDWAIDTGKITAGDARPKLSGLRSRVQAILGDNVHHVDVSIIKMGGAFDNGPFIGIR